MNGNGTAAGLDDLDRRVIAALQVDGRAPWRLTAQVLGEPERTVARRGTRLIEAGIVTVTGLVWRGETVIVRGRCRPGMARQAALAVSRLENTVFGYVLAGPMDVVAEVQCPPAELADFLLTTVPELPGLQFQEVAPVLRYFRTVREWQPGLLDAGQVAQLARYPAARDTGGGPSAPDVEIGPEERALLAALAENGRRTHEELAAIAQVSEATARRRVETLRQAGMVGIRAAVEPAVLGLPVEALLWIRTRPDAVEQVGRLAVESSPLVRYAAAVMGDHQLIIDVVQPSKEELYRYLADAPWVRHAEAVQSHLVVEALKRSGTSTALMRAREGGL